MSQPPSQYFAFRVVLALAVAGVAAMIPGFLHVEVKQIIRATGAIAVFAIVYFFSPAELVIKPDRVPGAGSVATLGGSPNSGVSSAQRGAENSEVNKKRDESQTRGAPSHLLRYAWSRQTKVYHDRSCCWVRRIKNENLITADDPPTDRRLHKGCPTIEGTGGCIN